MKEIVEIRALLEVVVRKQPDMLIVTCMIQQLLDMADKSGWLNPADDKVVGVFADRPESHCVNMPMSGVDLTVSEAKCIGITDDPTDPLLGRGVDTEPVPQNEVYLVLSAEERAKGFVRPLRRSYRHVGSQKMGGGDGCGMTTMMGIALCETYARDPKFYGSTYCCACRRHLPVAEFTWTDDNTEVGE